MGSASTTSLLFYVLACKLLKLLSLPCIRRARPQGRAPLVRGPLLSPRGEGPPQGTVSAFRRRCSPSTVSSPDTGGHVLGRPVWERRGPADPGMPVRLGEPGVGGQHPAAGTARFKAVPAPCLREAPYHLAYQQLYFPISSAQGGSSRSSSHPLPCSPPRHRH